MDSLVCIIVLVLAVIFFGSLVKRVVLHTTKVVDNLLESAVDSSSVVRISAAMYKAEALKEASTKLGDELLDEKELLRRLRGE
jgi:hypothetical protein